jgi:hypothetical protein
MKPTMTPQKIAAVSVPMLGIGVKSLAFFRLWIAFFPTVGLRLAFGLAQRMIDSPLNTALGGKGLEIQRRQLP